VGGGDLTLTVDVDVDEVEQGAQFSPTVTITNNSAAPIRTDSWLTVSPGGAIVFLETRTIAAGATVVRVYTHTVPADFNPGNYVGRVYAGDFATLTPIAGDGYRLRVIRADPGDDDIAATAPSSAITSEAAVSPNPFRGQAAVRFTLAEAADVRLAVYDVLGREVAVLVDGHVEAGAHQAMFDGHGLAPGTYLYRLTTGSEVQTGRMTLAR
jgi:hypothetical protein